MCHLPLLMPILGLAVYWFLPISVATIIYVIILILSAWLYYYVIKAMHRPVVSGMESMLHSDGKVVTKEGDVLQVRVHSELWDAESSDDLWPGDQIEVIGAKGLKLKVRALKELKA
jgi:membrane protein implicated in regulation of membrane protease activity